MSGGRRRSEMEAGGKDHLCGDWSPGPTAQCWLSFNPPLLPPQRRRETGKPRGELPPRFRNAVTAGDKPRRERGGFFQKNKSQFRFKTRAKLAITAAACRL